MAPPVRAQAKQTTVGRASEEKSKRSKPRLDERKRSKPRSVRACFASEANPRSVRASLLCKKASDGASGASASEANPRSVRASEAREGVFSAGPQDLCSK
ncbi:hypothetical protein CLOM_g5280 [Closterium sp. NIES-68]|nr:hypothetical protein CLOM_g2356 [Closterium sp. NIES-68]GJP45943.1 hypothetical protein CLOM_g5280 [Closterium sp. NIES-68]